MSLLWFLNFFISSYSICASSLCSCVAVTLVHFVIDQVLLFGASDSYSGDKIMQVTLAFNHFGKGLIQRMPRCRWGFFHIVNKEYTHWLMYAIVGSQQPTIISQGNRFVASPNPNAKEVCNVNKFIIYNIVCNWIATIQNILYISAYPVFR